MKKTKIIIFLLIIFSANVITAQNRVYKKLNPRTKKDISVRRQGCQPITKLTPINSDLTTNQEIVFEWKPNELNESNKIQYEITILKVDESLSLDQNIRKNDVLLTEKVSNTTKFVLNKIELNRTYLWNINVLNCKPLIKSEWWSFFPTNLEFEDALSCENSPIVNNSFEYGREGWDIKEGAPNFVNKGKGCNGPGYVELKGNNVNYDMISQRINSTIKQGSHYKIKYCLKNNIEGQKLPLVNIVAFNGAPANYNISSQVALVHTSGQIPYFDEWSEFETPTWTANKDFDNLGFYIINQNKERVDSKILLDNICLIEVEDNNCEEEIAVEFNNEGQYKITDKKTKTIIDSGKSKISETNHDYLRGSTNDLYGNLDTSTDAFYENLDLTSPCFSIGEYDPSKDFKEIDSKIDTTELKNIVEEIKKKAKKALNEPFLPKKLDPIIDVGFPSDNKQCNVSNPNLPFGGADIIYVHGLALGHLTEALKSDKKDKKFKATWPADANEFYQGDYKQYADDYWQDHIASELMDNNGKLTNRYLTVAYPCDQRLGDGIHAVLTQISDAIRTGKGVEFDRSDPRGKNCFGNKIVIVSHSTGGLLVSSLLGIGELSKRDIDIQNAYGNNLNNITDRVEVHLALNPALSGSKLASLAVVAPKLLGKIVGTSNPLAAVAAEATLNKYNNVVDNSVLIDLIPPVSQYYWGKRYYDKTKTQTITLAGSTPGLPQSGAMGWAGKFFIKGYNDGVVSMDSQCGSNQPWLIPSNYRISNRLKMIDFGNPFTTKALGLLYDSRFIGNRRISACMPYVTPAGMLTPYKSRGSGIKRWKNHHSFIQSTMTHFDTTSEIIRYYPNYSPSIVSNINNYEEVRVIRDDYIYTSGLVNNNFKNMVNEHVRKKTIGFHFPAVKRKRGFPGFKVYWKYHEITIWKRTYHLLQDYENKNGVDYMYDYILR